jgi:zinc/manganese transport system substrate-binding protein
MPSHPGCATVLTAGWLRALAVGLGISLLAGLVTACGSSAASSTSSGSPIRIVAAENFWGSIATQVGGKDVTVTSIITNPAADPHDYEPTPGDAREIATADLVIVNGVGYDGWADKLLATSPGRTVINVGDLVGAKDGDNPHRWYNPTDVRTFIAALTTDLSKLRPAKAADFARGRASFENVGLKTYDGLIASIKAKYAGTPVGASESILAMLTPALGLDLITPPSFLRAISEGSDVSAADKTTIDRQIATNQIKIYIYNSQNTTPDVQTQLAACRAKGIPTATVTETLSPASDTYQQWQSAQLRGIQAALAKATGK